MCVLATLVVVVVHSAEWYRVLVVVYISTTCIV